MYSLAPAWMAATAARASLLTPQATIGIDDALGLEPQHQVADVERDVDHQEIGAAAGAQHVQRLIDVARRG